VPPVEGNSFQDLKVCVHQVFVLSVLLFTMVFEALSSNFRIGLTWELLYADGLVLIADSMDEIIVKFKMRWDGVRVNINKTKVMVNGIGCGIDMVGNGLVVYARKV